MINIYYRRFVLREFISQSNITPEAKPEIRDAMRNPFRTKHINDSIFIADLVT